VLLGLAVVLRPGDSRIGDAGLLLDGCHRCRNRAGEKEFRPTLKIIAEAQANVKRRVLGTRVTIGFRVYDTQKKNLYQPGARYSLAGSPKGRREPIRSREIRIVRVRRMVSIACWLGRAGVQRGIPVGCCRVADPAKY
jgi:hypothetical protein